MIKLFWFLVFVCTCVLCAIEVNTLTDGQLFDIRFGWNHTGSVIWIKGFGHVYII